MGSLATLPGRRASSLFLVSNEGYEFHAAVVLRSLGNSQVTTPLLWSWCCQARRGGVLWTWSGAGQRGERYKGQIAVQESSTSSRAPQDGHCGESVGRKCLRWQVWRT